MMRTTATLARALGVLIVAAAFVGCADDDDEIVDVIPGVETGTLVQSWTIEGTKDVAKCQQYSADRMRLVIFDATGDVSATEFAACGLFEIALDLRTDTYTGNATFVNAGGDPVSQTIPIGQFSIAQDTRTTMTLNFDAAAMTPP